MLRRTHFLVVFSWLIILAAAVVTPTAQADSPTTVYAAFQQYENGYMVWLSDSGGVWMLSASAWTALYFPQATYETLPDNPVTDSPPTNMVKPIRGFGRVWGNFPEVRVALGWAIGQEVGYYASYGPAGYSAGGLSQQFLTLPDGRSMVLREDGTWQNIGAPRFINSLRSPSTFPGAIQRFERGYLMWLSETGTIWALYFTGGWEQYDSLTYGPLPDNPVTDTIPAGLVRPILGFGRVWGNFPNVRQALGWGLAGEQGYRMTFTRTVTPGRGVSLILSTPYATSFVLRDSGTWYSQ